MALDIITRKEWGARTPRSRSSTTWGKRSEFVVHYSAGPTSQTPRQIQNFHMDSNGWADVGYNFLVDRLGRIYEGRGWLVIGAHADGHNTSGIGVCFIGRNGDATEAALRSIRALYEEARRRAGRALTRRGHGQLSGQSTACPGEQLLNWVKAGMPVGGRPEGEDDMPTPKELWDHEIEVPWGTEENPEWQADSILVNTGARARNIEAKVDLLLAKIEALQAANAELVRTVALLAANPDAIDVDALVARIEAKIEAIDVRLEVPETEDA